MSSWHTRPAIATSHRRTVVDIVCQPQLRREREPALLRKSIWYWCWLTLTHSCFFVNAIQPQLTPHPRLSLRCICWISSAWMPLPFSTSPFHIPCMCFNFSLPVVIYSGHSEELEASLYLLHLHTTFTISNQCYASFICRTGWPIYTLVPWNDTSPLLRCIVLLSRWPQAAAVGVAARLN